MLDTLDLVFDESAFVIDEPNIFKPSASILWNKPKELFGTRFFPKYIPSNGLLEYYPKIQLYENTVYGRRRIEMGIECSIPKLIKGENLFSIRAGAKELFARYLVQCLQKLGIRVEEKSILSAKVRKIHFAHNMMIDSPVEYTIDELSLVDVWKYDPTIQKDSFKNGGECFHIHHSSYELVFYNKTKDIERSHGMGKKIFVSRKNPNYEIYQRYLAEHQYHILRMEYRLNDILYVKKEVNKVLNRALNTKVTVEDCFSDELVQQILLKQWDRIEKAYTKYPVYRRDDVDFLVEIIRNNPRKQYRHLLELSTITKIITERGCAFTTQLLGSFFGKKKAKILIKDALNLKFPCKSINVLAQIRNGLEEFMPLTPELLVNKVKKSKIKLSMDNGKFLTVEEMAQALQVVPMTIYRYIKKGKLTAYKFGKSYRIYEADFKRFIESCKVQTNEDPQ